MKNNDSNYVEMMVGPEGKKVRRWVQLPCSPRMMERYVKYHTAFPCMLAMQDAKGNYRPTIECSNYGRYLMAECYDLLQELRGDDRRAHRYVNEAMRQSACDDAHGHALQMNSNPYHTDETMEVYSNQADREATVLAVIGDEILVEYEMPAGSTAMLQFTVLGGELRKRKNVAYNTCPKRWIAAMVEQGMEWIGAGQRGNVAFPG